MARIKYFTPLGPKTIDTNSARLHKRTMEPWLYKEKFDKDGWFRASALEAGHVERVDFKDGGLNEVSLSFDNGKFIVRGCANGREYVGSWATLYPARDFFVSVVKKIYID